MGVPLDGVDDSSSDSSSKKSKDQTGAQKATGILADSINKATSDNTDRALARSAQAAANDTPDSPKQYAIPSMKRGGKMRKSGTARLHKGERARPGRRCSR